jgi:acetyl-CoA carboxylase carboxyl transferase subunit beta
MAFPAKTPAQTHESEKRSLGAGVFEKCKGCGVTLEAEVLHRYFMVCPSCGYHHRMPYDRWQELLLDDGQLELWDEHIAPTDPLEFFDGTSYRDRLARAKRNTGSGEGIQVGRGKLEGHTIAYGCFVYGFMGGSMGSVVGERMTRLFERATQDRLPVVLLHASGGARMQEGILSLMQMAKSVSALSRFRDARLPFLSVLLDPTTGGVAASTAFLGDVNLVEPNALIGFAGPVVIKNTLRTELPEGFQRSEFLLGHGMVDTIVPRAEMKQTLAILLSHLQSPRGGE